MRQRAGMVGGAFFVVLAGMLVVVSAAGAARAKPHISFTPQSSGSADYGNVVVGDTKSQAFTLTNDGGRATSKLTVSLNGASVFTKTADMCSGKGLKPGASCSVTVKYTPTAAGKDSSSVLAVNLNGNVRASIDLTGTGLDPVYRLTWLPSDNFVITQPGGSTQFTLLNSGNRPVTFANGASYIDEAPLVVNSTDFFGCLQAHLAGVGTPLAVGAHCTITVSQPTPCGEPIALFAQMSYNYFTNAEQTTTDTARANVTALRSPCIP